MDHFSILCNNPQIPIFIILRCNDTYFNDLVKYVSFSQQMFQHVVRKTKTIMLMVETALLRKNDYNVCKVL